jgi:hypothetical protein
VAESWTALLDARRIPPTAAATIHQILDLVTRLGTDGPVPMLPSTPAMSRSP